MTSFVRVIIITNIPSPYRVTLFNSLTEIMGEQLFVIYCSKIESNRNWELPCLKHNHLFLKEKSLRIGKRNIYFNPELWSELKRRNPEIVVTGGFTPTMLIAILFTKVFRKKHYINTDAWEKTEKDLSIIHKIVRKYIYKDVYAFLPVSKKGKINFTKNYSVNEDKIFIVNYAIDNDYYYKFKDTSKRYDIMFAGQFIDRKMPLFFCNVANALSKIYNNLRVLIIGSGPLERSTISFFEQNNIDFDYPGFIQPKFIPQYFASSKILLFPTLEDAWGVIANEACAVGVPVITCSNAGVSDELIKHNQNGFVLPLNEEVWVQKCLKLLNNKDLYSLFSSNALQIVDNYSIEAAVTGFKNSLDFILRHEFK